MFANNRVRNRVNKEVIMRYLLNKLAPLLGVGAFYVVYALFAVFAVAPMIALSFPWWALFLTVAFTMVFKKIGGLVYVVLYVWSFVVMVQTPFSAFSVFYFLSFAFWFLCMFLPSVLNIVFGRSN